MNWHIAIFALCSSAGRLWPYVAAIMHVFSRSSSCSRGCGHVGDESRRSLPHAALRGGIVNVKRNRVEYSDGKRGRRDKKRKKGRKWRDGEKEREREK